MLKKILLLACILGGFQAVHAQSLGSLVNAAKSAASNVVSNAKEKVEASLIGTQTVTAHQLVGTWSYQEPSLVFESNSFVNQVGAAALSKQAEKSAVAYLSKMGVTAGTLQVAFKSNGHYTASLKGRSISGTYQVNGATLTLVAPQGVVSVPVNAKIQGNQLQLSVHADKLLPLLQTLVGNVSQSAQQSAMISKVLKQYKGVLIGLKLKK